MQDADLEGNPHGEFQFLWVFLIYFFISAVQDNLNQLTFCSIIIKQQVKGVWKPCSFAGRTLGAQTCEWRRGSRVRSLYPTLLDSTDPQPPVETTPF